MIPTAAQRKRPQWGARLLAVTAASALAIGMAIGGGATATADSPTAAVPAARGTGSLEGIVINATTGQPAEGVLVRDDNNGELTDSNGHYLLTGLNSGKRLITIGGRGEGLYATTERTVTIESGTRSHANFEVVKGSTLKGTVTDAKGEPFEVENTLVLARAAWVNSSGQKRSWTERDRPDQIGRYSIRYLDDHEYTLRVRYCVNSTSPSRECVSTDVKKFSAVPPTAYTENIAVNLEFENRDRPTISGTRTVGKTLRAEPARWTITPTSWSYRWYRDGAPIGGATKRSYTLKSKDAGHRISVKYTASREHFTTAGRMALQTPKIRRAG